MHLWQWQRNANVVWHTASDCITGTGVPFRLDMEQRAISPVHAYDPLITISESDDARVVWPDSGIRLFERTNSRDFIPDWNLRMKRMWNVCLGNVPFGAVC